MRRKTGAATLAIMCGLALSACARLGVPDLPHSYVAQSYVRNDFSLSVLYRVTTGRKLPVRVIGQPFPGAPPAEFGQKIVAAMPSGFLNHGGYVLDPGGIAGTGTRIVWNFDPDPREKSDQVCLGHTSGVTRRPAAGTAVQLRVTVALCDEGSAYVANYGGIEITGPDDPHLADFIAQMTTSTLLTPPSENSPGMGWTLGM